MQGTHQPAFTRGCARTRILAGVYRRRAIRMRVAINGAGIAGPTLAWWLQRAGHEVILVERAPAVREGGYVVDFWGLGYDIAEKMGLDMSKPRSLWRDRTLIELNIAVLHSFDQHGVTIVDHHAASDYFMEFEEAEIKAGRDVNALWSWIVPPVSGSLTKVFHRDYVYEIHKPNYFHQARAW